MAKEVPASWLVLLTILEESNRYERSILIPDMQSGRADICFNSDDCYGGLYCGTTMDIWLNEQWVPTRMDSRSWFLAGVQIETL